MSDDGDDKLLYLSQKDIEFYNENGYLVIESFWNDETVATLRDKIFQIIQSLDLTKYKSIFAPRREDTIRNTDDYFLESAYDIRYFWEGKAWDENNELKYPPEVSINKIGHGLHELDEDFQRVSYDDRIGRICHDLGMKVPLPVQSMYIFKQASIGGEVIPHQDGAFLYTEPQTCIGFWWPLDDCKITNGCLWAVPGSHRLGVHRRYRRRDPPNIGTEFLPTEPIEWDISQAIPLEIPKGSLVILHSALVHYSLENTSSTPRHAYSIHVVDGGEGILYPRDNWLQRPPEHPFKPIIVTN